MKRLVVICLVGILFGAISLVAGCGGDGGQNISTPSSGSVIGMETIPTDSDTDVPTDSWIRVYWPYRDLRPPSDFTVRLQRADSSGNWISVSTRLRADESDPDLGSWWFEPAFLLNTNTWHRIQVTDGDGGTDVSVFRTRGFSVAGAGPAYKPAGASESVSPSTDGALEHRIAR